MRCWGRFLHIVWGTPGGGGSLVVGEVDAVVADHTPHGGVWLPVLIRAAPGRGRCPVVHEVHAAMPLRAHTITHWCILRQHGTVMHGSSSPRRRAMW